jgi:para-aminobenzoate synthetase/4-amino-4-deoxychorismate lyase
VFETLLVADGRPVALERHLERLARSVDALYGAELPPGLAAELTAAVEHAGRARLRVNARPTGAGAAVAIDSELSELAARRLPVQLIPRTLPGGVGGHKWIDRRDGLVLETARANVFCVEPDGRLLTPPADGRILPGVTRDRVLELAPRLGLIVTVEPLTLRRLEHAEEVFVTGSLGGLEPAWITAPTPEQPGAVRAQLAQALAEWEMVPA